MEAMRLFGVQLTSFTLMFVHFCLLSFPRNPSVNPKEIQKQSVRSNFHFPDERSLNSTLEER